MSNADRPDAGTAAVPAKQEVTALAPLSPASRVSLACECSSVLNFATEQNGVPLVREVIVHNAGAEPLQGVVLEITVEPGLSERCEHPIPSVAPGADFRLRALEVSLVPGKLREVTEAEVATMRLRLVREGVVLAEHRSPLRVLAFNEWPGSAAPTALLSSFVLPNHPVVTAILQSVREELRAQSLPDALDGYQSGDPNRARALVEATYRALQALGIGYVGLPASFEETGQKIRLPDAVVGDRLACCLDLTVLFAAALEQMGLAPLLFLVKGHAFAGVWLKDERFPEGVVEDAARIRTLVQLGQVLPLETTAVASADRLSFEAAVGAALTRLAEDAAFRCALDVRVVRTEYRPLPIRTVRAPGAESLGDLTPVAAQSLAAKLLARAAAVPPPEAPPPPPTPDVAQRFMRWKERLLDLTLRNRLLNFKIDGKACCQLAVPDLEQLEDALYAGRSFAIVPRPELDGRDERDAALAQRAVQAQANELRLADLGRGIVHARHATEELWTRLKSLDREARTALEEGGASVLYLAIGFLRWYESPASADAILAPILLYPVEFRFDTRRRLAHVRRLPDDPILNVTLLERLRRDFAVDAEALASLPMEGQREGADAGVDVSLLLTRVREAIQRLPRWEVLEEAHLGLFSFTKFLMWKDLDENADRFLENPVVRRVASREIVSLNQAELVTPAQVDDRHPADLPTVLDADSTQLAAIASSLDGQSFVLQGPPGTGKSQTIANLIAANLARGRTVLFVSEKMAALEVVHRRLCDVGLEDFCLELHSHKSNKKDVVESLRRALVHDRRSSANGWRAQGDQLVEARGHLDRYVQALHAPREVGASVYELRGRLRELHAVPEVALSPALLAGLTPDRLAALRLQVEEFSGVASGVEPAEAHPFRGSRRTDWSQAGEEQVRSAVSGAQGALRGWEAARGKLAGQGGAAETSAAAEELARLASVADLECGAQPALDPSWPDGARRIRACVEARALAEGRRAEVAQRWAASVLDVETRPLVQRFERWAGAFFLLSWIMLWGARRSLKAHARGALPRNDRILEDLRLVQLLAEGADQVRAESSWVGALLATGPAVPFGRWATMADRLDAAHAALGRLRGTSAVSEETLRAVASPGDSLRRGALVAAGQEAERAAGILREAEAGLVASLALAASALPPWSSPEHHRQLSVLLGGWQQGLRRLRPWCLYQSAAARLASAGLAELAEGHAAGAIRAEALLPALDKAVSRLAHDAALDAEPELRLFDAGQHAKRVGHFVDLDRRHVGASRLHVLASLEARLPALSASEIASSEPAIVMREAQKKARHLPIRKLLQQIPSMLPRLKPCLLMSPMSVAQYLPAETQPFDLVVFDEASQISTHDAIGAIARGTQVVIVGDSRQMPPTSFFARTEREDEIPDENDVVELESVLEEAVAKLVPQHWLGWHYRSRHEALIDFSNRNIYEGRLDVFPAAQFESDDVGVHWRKVPDGVYQGGTGKGGRTNRREAEALVAYLVERLRALEPGERTFGVVTFNVPQQHLVLDLLDDARQDPLVERHFSGPEAVFVKNLENVQGDERDEILFSICSAPDMTGRFSMQIGALSLAGGERRLNVAITRARRKLLVFSSIEPERIDRSRSKARGLWLLRDFLVFARDGRRAEQTGRAGAALLGPLERDMATVLEGQGCRVDAGVGCSGYRLDLAVRDPSVPGRYAVAVESDGPAYRMARSARDRDRLRSQVLASMGWRLERIWSSSWWFDEDAPRRLGERVQQAMSSPATQEVRYTSMAAPTLADPASSPEEELAIQEAAPPEQALGAPYRPTTFQERPGLPEAFYEYRSTSALLRQVAAVVGQEGPIHKRLLARRVADHWGVTRLTVNPMRRIGELLEATVAAGQANLRGEVVWPADLDPATYRGFRNGVDGEARELPLVPPEEVANAIERLLRDAGSLDREVLAREVARLFGVSRMGANVREALDQGVELLLGSGRAVAKEDRLALAP